MSDSASARPLRFVEKARFTAACAIAVALFLSVGWTVVRPIDPYAAVTLLLQDRPWPALVGVVAALSVVASVVATVVAGVPLPHAGVAATAVGLAVMATRGGTMTKLLMYHGTTPAERRSLALLLAIEVALWTAAIWAAWLAESAALRWLGAAAAPDAPAEPRASTGSRVVDALVRWRDGLLGGAVCVAVAWIVITLAISRTPASAIERGQVYFAVSLGFFAGALAGHQLWRRGAAGWYALGVAVLAVIGYGLGYVRPTPALPLYAGLATTPPNALFRALPVEYLSMGVVGSLAGYWFSRRLHAGRAAARAGS